MQLFLFLLVPAGLFYGYWYFIRKAQPIVAHASTVAHFESIVPIVEEQEIELLYESSPEIDLPVLLQGDETVLLLEAEKIITEIETIVSSKANVLVKLKSLLSGFNLFYNTDYQEAINRFIAATLTSECELDLTDAEIAALWS
jgi:hypothetical protein